VDVSEACMRMRMVKSEEEIAVIRQSARAADMAGYAIRDALREGIAEYELTQIGVQVNRLSLMVKTYFK
jgi:creatinase